LAEARIEYRNIVNIERVDPKFKHDIMRMPGTERIHLCFQCGTCTADCVISRFSGFYKPRKIARMVQLGLKDRLLSNDDIWLCTTCFTCVDHCPQDVEVSSIVRALRNMAVRERKIMPGVIKAFASNILKSGYVYLMPKSRLKRREAEGLPPLPGSKVEDLLELFKATGLLDLLESAESLDKVDVKVGDRRGES
jgi:heterodisulfide reductase subunit C